MLDQQDAGPEQVDEAESLGKQLDAHLVRREPLAVDAEDNEELVVKRLRIALLVAWPSPVGGEAHGARTDDVPTQPLHDVPSRRA